MKALSLFSITLLLFSCGAPKYTDKEIFEAIGNSDDLNLYKNELISATRKILDSRVCDLETIKYNGGWLRFQLKGPGVYFIYSKKAGAKISDRVYCNVKTGEVGR